MLDLNYIREHAEEVKKNSKDRGVNVDIDAILKLDGSRRELIQVIDKLRQERNAGSKSKPTPDEIERLRRMGDEIIRKEGELRDIEMKQRNLMLQVPNLTHPATPIGGENDFKVLASEGEPPHFDFKPLDHETLLTDLGLLDFERGAKVTGAKFFFAKGDLVKLGHALIAYGADIATKHGYELVETPDLARDEILQGIGFNPRGPETQVYSIENTDLSLIGTAEITMGGYHADEILDLSAGPKKYVALSHCFRTEAGAAGREQRGLYRVHQFTKLELFVYCKPEDSERLHQEILDIERELVRGLGLPYRVIDVASGDLGGPAYRKFDVEAWMVMKDDFGEITSASNCTDYQARRLNIRYRTDSGGTAFVHTLNGTAVNNVRWPLAIAENFQQADGSIIIPEVLRPYMNDSERIA